MSLELTLTISNANEYRILCEMSLELTSTISNEDRVLQPIADRVAQHLEIISKKFPTNQNSAHAIYD